MCCGAPSAPAPPPPPVAPPPLPKSTDPEIKRSKSRAKQTAALAQGRSSTLLGGQLESQPANQPKKTLLGR